MQWRAFLWSPLSKFVFWFMIVSIAIAVFPVCLSPIINSFSPLPIGTKSQLIWDLFALVRGLIFLKWYQELWPLLSFFFKIWLGHDHQLCNLRDPRLFRAFPLWLEYQQLFQFYQQHHLPKFLYHFLRRRYRRYQSLS